MHVHDIYIHACIHVHYNVETPMHAAVPHEASVRPRALLQGRGRPRACQVHVRPCAWRSTSPQHASRMHACACMPCYAFFRRTRMHACPCCAFFRRKSMHACMHAVLRLLQAQMDRLHMACYIPYVFMYMHACINVHIHVRSTHAFMHGCAYTHAFNTYTHAFMHERFYKYARTRVRTCAHPKMRTRGRENTLPRTQGRESTLPRTRGRESTLPRTRGRESTLPKTRGRENTLPSPGVAKIDYQAPEAQK